MAAAAPDCPFTLAYLSDAYSTDAKVMGRQAAGKALMKAVARVWREGVVRGVGNERQGGSAMLRQLRADGFAGELRWGIPPDWRAATDTGTLYFPAPIAAEWAAARNALDPTAFSFMGVTHTVATMASASLVTALLLPPFQPWDALICTSAAARKWVAGLHDEMRSYWRDALGPVQLNEVQLPVIPLGVDTEALALRPGEREAARQALGVAGDDVVFLFAGRLAVQAKANPLPMYQALEHAARTQRVVCIEAGIYPNAGMQRLFEEARAAIAPSVRFVWVDGKDDAAYRRAWQAADAFVSLADNIQETFGLTPVEAMAAGLPVVVSDWSGYRDTVRDGVDGFRLPAIVPPPGSGEGMALRYALGADTYDLYIGQASLATVVVPLAIQETVRRLAGDAALRRRMGAAGQARARQEYDWAVVLGRYAELAAELGRIRRASPPRGPRPAPPLADPFRRFQHFASATLAAHWEVAPRPDAASRLPVLLALRAASFGFDAGDPVRPALLAALERSGPCTVADLLAAAGQVSAAGAQALMWLWKFDLVDVRPPRAQQPKA